MYIFPEHRLDQPYRLIKSILSFREMAKTGNIQDAAQRIGVTRITLRDRVRFLESFHDAPLYVPGGGGIQLTETGRALHERTDAIIMNLEMLLAETFYDSKDPQLNEEALKYFQQRYSLLKIKEQTPLIRIGYEDWQSCQGELGATGLAWLWQYILSYRSVPDGWLCIHIGEKSSYATWFGRSWAMSAIGYLSSTDPTGENYDLIATQGYFDVMRWGSPRLDHVHTALSRRKGEQVEWVSYQRLLLPCTLPSGEAVVVSLVARTNQIKIDALKGHDITLMAEHYLMEDEPNDR